jgi:hypothetical protein
MAAAKSQEIDITHLLWDSFIFRRVPLLGLLRVVRNLSRRLAEGLLLCSCRHLDEEPIRWLLGGSLLSRNCRESLEMLGWIICENQLSVGPTSSLSAN